MTNDLIIIEKVNHIGKIIFNNAPLNILTIGMMEQINEALEDFLEDESLKAVIFDHNGKAFSAGVDIGDHMGDKAPKMIKEFHGIFRKLNKLKCPTIASVKGAALGGGCEIAIFCDIVLTSDKAKFGQPEIKVGVFPPIAVIAFPQIIGNKKAFELIMLGEIIDANEAHRLGISNYVFPFDLYNQKFAKYIESFNNLSTIVLQYSKKAFNRALGIDFETKLDEIEEFYLKELMSTHDANEGLQSFLEKRSPNWQNR
ncbi:MAG: enoyl-CoA hydratase/isomerase family protein [Candidatus Lokiarchaeota archaeon]|nr:enoyl-CoA hydratase/isomerase family protein [Candidatus Lokiarchaeota archaeon]